MPLMRHSLNEIVNKHTVQAVMVEDNMVQINIDGEFWDKVHPDQFSNAWKLAKDKCKEKE